MSDDSDVLAVPLRSLPAVRFHRSGLIGAIFALIVVVPSAFGQTDDPAPASKPAQPSPDVTEVPPVADFFVIPLRVHILSATDLPAIECGLTDEDIRRIIGKVNTIWHKAGIHWDLGPIVHEPAVNQDRFKADPGQDTNHPLPLYLQLVPQESKAAEGLNVYYLHAFPVNGVYLGDRTAFVQETAKLRPVPGGIEEPLPRVTAHELGHALSLPHRQNRTNLLASGTSGTLLNQAEVDRVRDFAPKISGTATVPELERRLKEAQDRQEASEINRLETILKAIPAKTPPVATP